MSEGEAATLQVTGGAGGVRAHLDDLLRCADLLEEVARGLGGCALRVSAVAASPALAAAGPLAPVRLARAERALASAVAGRHGLTVLASACAVLAGDLRLVVGGYRLAEEASALAAHEVQAQLGIAAGLGLAAGAVAALGVGTAGVLVVGPAGVAGAAVEAPLVVGGLGEGVARVSGAAMEWLGQAGAGALLDHPEAAEAVVGSLPWAAGAALLAAVPAPLLAPAAPLMPSRPGVPGAAAVLAGLPWACEPPGVRVTTVRTAPVTVTPSAAGLLALVPDGAGEPSVRVVGVDGPRGRAWVVAVPGTRSWAVPAGREPLDAVANVRLVAGAPTASRQAVVAAMAGAGVRPGEPVVLVGHSQGGLVAASIAADPALRARFRVSHVVTAGSPVATTPVPADVRVLALEHRRDVVPRLEGAANPARPGWWTVRTDPAGAGAGTPERLLAQHALDGYRHTGALVDAAADPGLRRWHDGLAEVLGEAPRQGTAWEVEATRGADRCVP
ncbi:MAG: hypothetical protein U0Q15_02490 [Kineosporiaceae bacterium]